MASSIHQFLCSVILFLVLSQSIAQQSFRPKALVVPVTKDSATLQYVTQIKQRTPRVPINLVVDLVANSYGLTVTRIMCRPHTVQHVVAQPCARLLKLVVVVIVSQGLGQVATIILVVSFLTTQ